MSQNHAHIPSSHPKLTHLTRDRSASLPHSNMNPARQNPLDSDVPYSYARKGSLPYNNLPRYPPNEEASDNTNKLPSLPLPRKASLEPSSSSARPPLSSPARSSGTSSYSRRKYPTIGQRPKLPPVEPLKIVKRRAGHTPSDQPSGSPTSPSSGYASVPARIQELLVDHSSESPPSQILSAPLRRFQNYSVEEAGQASAVSVDGAFKNNETTSGYVYKPSAVVLTDEYYYSQTPKEPLQRSSSVSRVGKMSGSFFKKFKGGENKKT